jgi:hypothetical protein
MALLGTSAESGLNKFLEEFIEQKNAIQGLKRFEILKTENVTSDNIVTTKNDAYSGKLQQHYKHIQLDQRIITEDSAIGIRMAKIAEINFKNQNEANRSQVFYSRVSQLKDPFKEEFVEKAIDFACKIQSGYLRAQTLSLIIPILEGKKKR